MLRNLLGTINSIRGGPSPSRILFQNGGSMLCTMEEILNYKNEPVVRRFQKDFPQKADRAQDIFEDLMRFFWGTKIHHNEKTRSPSDKDLDFFFIMDDDMREIDHMWHIFLLYTKDYQEFCQKYFGEFLHHQPDLVPLFEQKGFEFEQNLERFLNYNLQLFGEEVLSRWFQPTLALTPQQTGS